MNTLQLVFGDIRDKTLRLFESAPDDVLTWTPPGTANPLIWHAGHAVWVIDVLCVQPLTGRSDVSPDWTETFGANRRPPAQTKTWPTRDDVIAALRRQRESVLALLGSATPAQLAELAPSKRPGTTKEMWAVHAFHDEANHQGEMYLLLKLAKAR
jgi:hypothetical protein